jgi:hypothetical protein
VPAAICVDDRSDRSSRSAPTAARP